MYTDQTYQKKQDDRLLKSEDNVNNTIMYLKDYIVQSKERVQSTQRDIQEVIERMINE